MENNRNLSSIISKIRDEGPPGSEVKATPLIPVEAGPVHDDTDVQQNVPTGPAGHRVSLQRLRRLLLLLVITIGMVFLAASYTGDRNGGGLAGIGGAVRGWFSAAPDASGKGAVSRTGVVAGDAVDEQLVRDLQVRQLEIMNRLDRLTETVTALDETVDRNRMDYDTETAGLRQQGAAIRRLEATLTTLRQRLAGVVEKPAATAESTAAGTASGTLGVPAKAAATQSETPQAVAGSDWVVNIASSSHGQAMQDLAAKLREQGIPVERHTLTIEGDLMYRLRVPGFATSGEARRYAEKLDKEFGLRGGWVSRK